MRFFKTIILTSSILLFFFILHHSPFIIHVHAQTPPVQQINPYAVPDTNPDVPKNLHTFSQSIILDIMSFMMCQLAGVDPISQNHACLGFDPKTKKIGYIPSGNTGLIGFVGSGISMMYTPPLHTNDYIHYLASSFQSPLTGKHAYADQGVGFTGLQPLLKLWVVSRNVSYALLVIIFILTGLFVMLRVKIDPRTVLSIQNQLPKLVIGILLITFSFAIVGILIDGMYLITFIVLGLIGNALGDPGFTDIANLTNPLAAANKFNGGVAGGFLAIPMFMGYTVRNIVNSMVSGVPFLGGLNQFIYILFSPFSFACNIPGLNLILSDSYKTAFCNNAVGAFGFIAQPIAFIVVLLILIVALFKLWFALLKAYLTILFNVVLGPCMILFGLLPGMPGGFGGWFKTIASNLLAFPAVAIFLALGSAFAQLLSTGDTFAPPLSGLTPGGIDPITLGAVPVLGGVGPSKTITAVGTLLMLTTYLMAPGIPAEIMKLMKIEPGLDKGIGAAFAPGIGALGAAGKTAGKKVWYFGNPQLGEKSGIIQTLINSRSTNNGTRIFNDKTGKFVYRPTPMGLIARGMDLLNPHVHKPSS